MNTYKEQIIELYTEKLNLTGHMQAFLYSSKWSFSTRGWLVGNDEKVVHITYDIQNVPLNILHKSYMGHAKANYKIPLNLAPNTIGINKTNLILEIYENAGAGQCLISTDTVACHCRMHYVFDLLFTRHMKVSGILKSFDARIQALNKSRAA